MDILRVCVSYPHGIVAMMKMAILLTHITLQAFTKHFINARTGHIAFSTKPNATTIWQAVKWRRNAFLMRNSTTNIPYIYNQPLSFTFVRLPINSSGLYSF